MNGLQEQRGKSNTGAVIVLLATWLLGSACARDDVVAPSDTDATPEFRPAVAAQIARWRPLKDTIPPREIHERWAPRPWDAGPESLKEYVAQTGGRVAIGLKSPSEPRTAASGVIPGISRQRFTAALEGIIGEGVTVIETYRNLTGVSAVIDPDAVDRLLKLPFVNYIEPDIPATLASVQDTTWGMWKIGAPAAWDAGHQGYSAHIWILDTGVDEWHNASGYRDWHKLGGVCGWAYGLNDCYDDGSIAHGGLVHTVAVGPDNAVGYIGVAHDVHENFMIRVCDPGCPPGATASAIDSAITRGNPRTIINMSFGSVDPYTLRYDAIAAAWNSGILLVAAAGNNNYPGSGIMYPARHSQVIAVTGTTSSDAFAGQGVMACAFSNHGSEAELSAPFEQSGIGLGGDHYQTQCGTSFAAPAVAGVAALIWDKNPTWTASQVRYRLQNTAIDKGTAGRDSYFGYGRVDACKAVQCQVDFDISGPDELDPGEDGTWTVTNKSGGSGSGWSYQWYKEGELQSGETSSSYTTWFSEDGPHDPDIGVHVSSSGGLPRMRSKTVWLNICPPGEEWCE